jgi:hypothetical protein
LVADGDVAHHGAVPLHVAAADSLAVATPEEDSPVRCRWRLNATA